MDITLKYPRPQRHVAKQEMLLVETKDPVVESNLPHMPTAESVDGGECKHLDVADPELKKNIINEWQDNMTADAQRRLVCAVCARRTNASKISCLSAAILPLQLLRNEELPEKVMPTTYNFAAYQRALLHPSGLLNRERLGGVQVCEQCEKSLCQKNTIPKYALANWLYYGHDELPSEVAEAFDMATRFDLRLISRARASRICVRFTDLPGRQPGDPRPAVAQRFTKGNVMVLPQDVTELRAVLPPGPQDLKDTMSVLFVVNRHLDKPSITRMQPVLVRKSRIQKLIEFLMEHNPHYRKDTGFDGFSQENMDALFDISERSEDEGIPACVQIGHITMNDATEGATSEYTFRNEGEGPVDTRGDLLMENVGFTSGDNSPLSYQYMKHFRIPKLPYS
jgi:hypothetical protein